MLRTKFLKYLMAAAVLLTAAACSKEEPDDDINFGERPTTPVVPNPNDHSLKGNVAYRMEVPALRRGNLLVSHWSVEGRDSVMTYCLEYDAEKFHSRWVAFRFDPQTRPKKVGRKDYDIDPQYPADPELPANMALEPGALYGSGYNHGHLCASADRLYSRTGNDNTFFMTNMSPQLGRFNSSYWSKLENYVQDKGRDAVFADTLYVCKGGTIADGQVLKYVSRGRVPVPKYYFMALLKVKNGTHSSIAFWMEHKDYGFKPSYADLLAHAISVNELEQHTGIDFFPNLPDNKEEKTEDLCLPSAWGF